MNKSLIVIAGPTGIGKTKISVQIAQKLGTEIISADSRQIYKELSIGTAVPSEEELKAVKHHFIQTKSIYEYYNASMFEFEVIDLLKERFRYFDTMIMTGGSGMYINAVCEGIDELPTIDPELRKSLLNRLQNEGIESLRFELKQLDPEYYEKTDLKNPKRILKALEVCLMTGKTYSSMLTKTKKKRDFNIIKIALHRDRQELYRIIEKRVDNMIEQGLLEEAKQFYDSRHLNALNTVGYKELFGYFSGEYSLDYAISLIKRNTRRYAKRQLSWFKRDKDIRWFQPDEVQKISQYIENQIIKK